MFIFPVPSRSRARASGQDRTGWDLILAPSFLSPGAPHRTERGGTPSWRPPSCPMGGGGRGGVKGLNGEGRDQGTVSPLPSGQDKAGRDSILVPSLPSPAPAPRPWCPASPLTHPAFFSVSLPSQASGVFVGSAPQPETWHLQQGRA